MGAIGGVSLWVWPAVIGVLVGGAVIGYVTLFSGGESSPQAAAGTLNPQRAKTYLDGICKLGRRPSGSQGMAAQQKRLTRHFQQRGAKVGFQRFHAAHPLNGNPVRMANLIVQWHPRAKQRVLLACHYDTRPYPDEDPRQPRGVFLGANDGASGVALLMELAHHMPTIQPTFGVDFVFFDGEEFVFGKDAPLKQYFLGSKHFARQYVKHPPAHRYVAAVVVDMVGDRDLNLYIEKNSLRYAPDVTMSIWRTAARLRVREFIRRPKYEVNDDHIPLNETAKIPTCNVIDFDYPHWHTTGDVPAKCSGRSLAKVGRVLLKWLQTVPKPESD